MERVCMGILFVVLKIIGILLAAVVLLAAAAVAVPVRYRICIEVQDDAAGMAVFHWLFHAVDIRLFYQGKKFSWKMRILGIPVFWQKEGRPGPKKQRRKEKPDQGKRKEAKGQRSVRQQSGKLGMQSEGERNGEDPNSGFQEIGTQGSLGVPEGKAEAGNESLPEGTQGSLGHGARREDGTGQEPGAQKAAPKKRKVPVVKWIQQRFASARNRVQGARQKVSGFVSRCMELKKHPADIKKMLSEETNKEALGIAFQEFRYLCKHYSPARAWGDIRFSAGDPAQTGLVLGTASMVPFWAKYKIDLAPDFAAESFYVKGTLGAKGHIRAWHLLRSGIRLVREESIRKFITSVKK